MKRFLPEKLSIGTLIHIAMISIIVIIFATIAIKLFMWDSSAEEIPIETIDFNIFDTEPEDYYYTVDVNTIENYTDDGELRVVMLGDDSLKDYTDGSGIPALVAKNTDAITYTCSFPSMTMATQNMEFDVTYGYDAFSFYYAALCISKNDYAFLRDVLPTLPQTDRIADYESALSTLESIDFNTVDILVISCGAQDYLKGYTQVNTIFPEAYISNSYVDSIMQGIDWIRAEYPQIQFVIMSPTFCYYVEDDGSYANCDVKKTADNGTLADYMISAKSAAVAMNATYLDNYWGIDINAENAKAYLTDSTTYPNADGRKLIADKLSETLNEKIYYTGE